MGENPWRPGLCSGVFCIKKTPFNLGVVIRGRGEMVDTVVLKTTGCPAMRVRFPPSPRPNPRYYS